MTRAAEFRMTLRRGRRIGSRSVALHVLVHDSGPSRFGFIVPKTVGGAVTRNLVKRRLRECCRMLLAEVGDGKDVVIRALPASATTAWPELLAEVGGGVRKALA